MSCDIELIRGIESANLMAGESKTFEAISRRPDLENVIFQVA